MHDHGNCARCDQIDGELAKARAVVEAAREEHDENDCHAKSFACKVCDLVAAHDAALRPVGSGRRRGK